MSTRNVLQTRLKHDRNNAELQQQYKQERNRVKSLLRDAEQSYYRDKMYDCRGNSAVTWKIIKDITPNRKEANNNNNFVNELEMAEKFNDLFVSVGERTYQTTQNNLSNSNQNNVVPLPDVDDGHRFRPSPVDTNTVILTIKSLNNTKAAGSDGITLRYIQDSLPITIPYITTIINTSIVTGKFPTMWKHATVTPIYKNGDRDNINNYRPISLVPILSKVLEEIVAQQITTFLETGKLLSNTQHGFTPKLSTETALTILTNKLY